MVILTTEEYKEMILKEQETDILKEMYAESEVALMKEREKFDEFLLLITKGKESSQWQDGTFEEFDLADREVIASYINSNFFGNGKLKLRSVNND